MSKHITSTPMNNEEQVASRDKPLEESYIDLEVPRDKVNIIETVDAKNEDKGAKQVSLIVIIDPCLHKSTSGGL